IRYTGANHGVITDYEKPELEGIKYNVFPNSTVITGISPPNTPQLPVTNIPYETNITEEGQEKTYYIGDLNDLTNDVVNNTTWQDLVNTSINYQTGTSEPSYTLTPTQEGVIIITDPETEEIPTPYPNPDFEPIEDASEYQGKSIGLLQVIINWLKLIYDSIQNFFEMPEDLTLDTTSLRLVDFQLKFPFSIPWDLYNSINVFAETPSEPELIIDIDTEYLKVNHEIDISSIYLPLTFARYVATIFFIIYLANKTRDLIKW
ncbi:MAG: hypothetical protein PHI05_05100, partial [Bacilli bacterium]|nr:hypothetical protein [Bacilli bacterium]